MPNDLRRPNSLILSKTAMSMVFTMPKAMAMKATRNHRKMKKS